MAKKLAITISGAVSLGSYEAGVLYETIRAIQQHNNVETDAANRIEIDVLTGASAGGMTATIVAQKLLFEASSLLEPYNNSLYRAWVKDVGLDALLNLGSGDNPTHSILSSDHVESIAKKHITDRYATGLTPVQDRHNAVADQLFLGLSLSNLNGVDYLRKILFGGGSFCYSRYQDEMVREFAAGNPQDDTANAWNNIRDAAIATGAFPFAFRTKELIRQYSEYDPNYLPPVPLGSFPAPTRTFTYTDGGVFQNEPLGLAKSLVDKLDPNHLQHADRFFLFVSPSARAGTSNSTFNQKQNGDFVSTAKALATAIFNQSRFHDWIRAEELNEKISLLDKRATDLAQWLQSSGQYQLLQDFANALLPQLGIENLAQQRTRLKLQYPDEYTNLPSGADAAFIDGVLIFETLADLGDKDSMQILGITIGEEKLAGGKLEGFLGFFDQSYRDHDYDVGRTAVRDFIRANPEIAGLFPNYPKNDTELAAAVAKGESWLTIRAIDHSLDNLSLDKVPANLRQKFRDRLLENADDILDELNVPLLGRDALKTFFIKPQLDKWLGL